MRGFILSAAILMALGLGVGCKSETTGSGADVAGATASSLEAPTLESPSLLADLTIAPMDGKAIQLRYLPQPSGRHRVELEQHSAQTRGARALDIGTRQEFTLVRKLVNEGTDRWTTALRFDDMTVEPLGRSKDTAMEGAVESIKKALMGVRMEVTLDGRGTVHDVVVKGGDINRLQGMGQVLDQLVKDSIVELPEAPVAPGDRWPTVRESLLKTMKSANKITYALNSKFLGYAQGIDQCLRCAVVHTEGTFTIDGTITAPGMEGTSSGRGRLHAVVVLDVDAGRLMRSLTASVARQQFDLKGKNGGLVMSEEQSNQVVLEWLGSGDE
jgi:hypothetical protein